METPGRGRRGRIAPINARPPFVSWGLAMVAYRQSAPACGLTPGTEIPGVPCIDYRAIPCQRNAISCQRNARFVSRPDRLSVSAREPKMYLGELAGRAHCPRANLGPRGVASCMAVLRSANTLHGSFPSACASPCLYGHLRTHRARRRTNVTTRSFPYKHHRNCPHHRRYGPAPPAPNATRASHSPLS